MKTRAWFGAIFGTLAVGMLLASPMALADKAAAAPKLEGAWVAKVQEPHAGQWSYVLAPDASGRRAAGHGSVDLGFNPDYAFGCDFGAMDYEDSPILISLEMTGPDTAVAYSVWYAIKTVEPGVPAIAFIGEVRTEVKFVAAGKSESAHYFSFYGPDKDVNPQDGFPDEGAIPDCSAGDYALKTIDTRLPAP